jgi:hypothetical protein
VVELELGSHAVRGGALLVRAEALDAAQFALDAFVVR